MFTKNIDRRIRILFLFILLGLFLVIVRVFYIQVFEYKRLNSLSHDLWSRNLEIEADRGRILDRNGVVLADNLTTSSLVLVPNQIKNKEKVAKDLSNILGISYTSMKKHVYRKTSIERVHPEGRRLPYKIARKISKLKYDGVYLVREAKRNYPYKDFLSHVIGYVGVDNQGLSGIELQYDKYLKGDSGVIKFYSDAHGNRINLTDKYSASTPGMDVRLTIDVNIQKSLERELSNIEDMFTPDNALALVVDPNTGEVLGMSSSPSFDPNKYKEYGTSVLSRNLPIWSSYEPGSTFKVVTMASSVEEGIVDIFHDHFYDSGKVVVDGATIKCWKKGGHGDETFLQVMEGSCNPGFVSLALKLGKDKLFSYIDKFGFGNKTGIDLQGEATGIIFPLNKVGNVELATTGFGQGVSVTPIQQVMAVSAIVNGGTLYRPYIVKGITDKTNSNILENTPHKIRKVISKKTSNIMRIALESVVSKGGGKSAYIEGYRIGGKTGTAQKAKDGTYLYNNYIMSFMSVVPSNNPKAVLYLAIDNPKNTAMLSSYTTTPIARRILLDIIDALNIKKQKGEIEKDLEWNDTKYVEVPNVTGQSINDAKELLKDFNIIKEGNGNTIIYQSLKPKDKVPINSKIKLLLK